MEYVVAGEQDIIRIYDLVQQTIQSIYPKYYPAEVVGFFSNLHSLEAITKDVESGNTGILVVDKKIVGTGSFVDNHITRVYVAPDQQGKGYGTFMIQTIENEIAKNYNKAYLDASLPALDLYKKLGYQVVLREKYPVENGVLLEYEVMEKLV